MTSDACVNIQTFLFQVKAWNQELFSINLTNMTQTFTIPFTYLIVVTKKMPV